MIHDVDESLRALVRRDVLNGSKVDVSFEAPNKDWAARRQGPTLNLYLYDIREDLDRREVQFTEIRDENGRIVGRRQPPRRFKLSYLVTAWTQRPEDEHRLLAAVLAAGVSSDTIPEDLLEGALPEWAHMVRMTVALPLSQDRSISDVWTALGGELKASLDLVVTVPFPPKMERILEVGPWVTEEPRIGLIGPDGTVEVASSKPNGKARRAGKAGKAGKDGKDGDAKPALPDVMPGSQGEVVRDLQRKLRALGHEVPDSGVYDDITVYAVRAVQRQRGLEEDGIVSSAVWEVLEELSEAPVEQAVETFRGSKPGTRKGREFTIVSMPPAE